MTHRLIRKGPRALLPGGLGGEIVRTPEPVTVGSALPSPATFAPSLPAGYRAADPVYVDNPDAVLMIEDFQGYSVQGDLVGQGFGVGTGGDAASLDTPNTSPTEKRAQLVLDLPSFGKGVRMWHTDGSDGNGEATRFNRQVVGITDDVLYVVVVRYSPSFDGRTHDTYGGADGHKLIFNPGMRAHEHLGRGIRDAGEWISPGNHAQFTSGATQSLLPGAVGLAGTMYSTGSWSPTLWGDGQGNPTGNREFVRYIQRETVLSASSFRLMKWMHVLSEDEGAMMLSAPYLPTRNSDGAAAKIGHVWTNTGTDPSVLIGASRNKALGVNHNAAYNLGEADYWEVVFTCAIDLNEMPGGPFTDFDPDDMLS